jgi:nicotinic acid mononucleotide adenylyltransferase
MSEKITNIAVFGGAFDPIHNSHLSVIKNINSLPFIDEIWLLPSGMRSDRSSKPFLLLDEERIELLVKLMEKYRGEKVVKVVD